MSKSKPKPVTTCFRAGPEWICETFIGGHVFVERFATLRAARAAARRNGEVFRRVPASDCWEDC